MKICIVIPTYNPGNLFVELIQSIINQGIKPSNILVVDSESTDGMPDKTKVLGVHLVKINKSEFNHGGTRKLATKYIKADLYVFITQDVVVLPHSINRLVEVFLDKAVGVSYGRQLPHDNANYIAKHSRFFNYPAENNVRTLNDKNIYGIKTCFNSDSFSAYRAEALLDIGGFPEDVIGSEDAYVAGKMLLKKWSLAYVADACVKHSHNYSLIEEFNRYFDIGVFYGRESWIKKSYGMSSSEGKKYVISEIKYLWKNNRLLIIESALRTLLKYIGYKLGENENYLPKYIKRRLSMFKSYWD